jgi:hypothetical protein
MMGKEANVAYFRELFWQSPRETGNLQKSTVTRVGVLANIIGHLPNTDRSMRTSAESLGADRSVCCKVHSTLRKS